MTKLKKPLFREDKAVAVAATFLRFNNGECDKYWLNKVMYFVERQSLLLSGQPMFFDELFSAPYGPIVSNVNDGIDLAAYPSDSAWANYFHLENNNVTLKTEPDISVLSDFEINLIKQTFENFKGKKFNEMHDAFRTLPEHKETKSRLAISYEDILKAGGYKQEDIKDMIDEISYIQFLESTLNCSVG